MPVNKAAKAIKKKRAGRYLFLAAANPPVPEHSRNVDRVQLSVAAVTVVLYLASLTGPAFRAGAGSGIDRLGRKRTPDKENLNTTTTTARNG